MFAVSLQIIAWFSVALLKADGFAVVLPTSAGFHCALPTSGLIAVALLAVCRFTVSNALKTDKKYNIERSIQHPVGFMLKYQHLLGFLLNKPTGLLLP